jgi:hypothetical protein
LKNFLALNLFCEVLLMLRAFILAMPLLGVTLVSASAEAPPDPSANAALKYWQAFATLPTFTDEGQQKLRKECVTMPLDAHARELVTKADYALRMMHHGAELPRCDWGISYEDGIDVRLPHMNGALSLTSLVCLRARMRFEAGKSADALDDIVAALILGRHTSQNGVQIAVVVGYSIEHRLIETLALSLPKLSADEIKKLKTRLDNLPPGGTPAAAMKFEEKGFLDWFVREVKEKKDKESLLDLLSQYIRDQADSPERSREKGRAFLEECGGTAEGILKCAEQSRQSYERMAKQLVLPLNQFEEGFEREVKKQNGNPVFHVFFPALDRVRWSHARMDVRRALLSAALGVQLDGREALMKRPDPVVGGSFEYTAFEGGFELRSKLKLDEKLRTKWKLVDERAAEPLALTVGRRGK